MSWYTNYIRVYEQPIGSVSPSIIEEVRSKLKQLKEIEQQAQQGQQPNPIIASVVIIAHNEEEHLLSCLWSLCDNECDFPIEILVVNNQSTDRTEEVLQTLGATYYNEIQKGPGHARQCGLNHARGRYHLCVDADTVYPPHYIATHVRELSRKGVVCTFGLWSFMPDKHHSRAGLWVYETLRDLHLKLQAVKRPELCVRGMNFAFDTALARRFGFRTDIRRGEDGSLALNMKPYGRLVFLTGKRVRVLTGNATLNADGSLLKSLWVRIVKAGKGFVGLFTPKETYEDKDSNLLN
ncbi:glycosyltransferase family 2 protein [Bacteroides sp.]|uniref:glycosyltransferase family 2 protein n=1 Tax=Bacteroides sp. TaxID=29523 RepID=UPI002FC7DBAD